MGRYRPDAHWDFALLLDADDPDAFWNLLDERASWFYEAVGAGAAMAPKRPGPSSAYLSAYKDKAGQWLDGGRSYRLRVPPNPPIKLFWSVTLYDVDTRALILNEQKIADRSSRMDLRKNEDGSVDIYCGPNSAGRVREELDSDRPGQKLVCVFPVLPADRGLLRSVLAAAGLRASLEQARASATKSCVTKFNDIKGIQATTRSHSVKIVAPPRKTFAASARIFTVPAT